MHPAEKGSLVPRTASYLNEKFESQARRHPDIQHLRVPEYYKDDATLVRFDGEAICFVVTMRNYDASYARIVPDEVTLHHDAGTSPGRVVESVEPKRNDQSFDWTFNYVDQAGYNATQRKTRKVAVYEGGGTVCVEHEGAVPVDVTKLTLVLGGYKRFRVVFGFEILATTPPNAWTPGPMVAVGHEVLAQL